MKRATGGEPAEQRERKVARMMVAAGLRSAMTTVEEHETEHNEDGEDGEPTGGDDDLYAGVSEGT